MTVDWDAGGGWADGCTGLLPSLPRNSQLVATDSNLDMEKTYLLGLHTQLMARRKERRGGRLVTGSLKNAVAWALCR